MKASDFFWQLPESLSEEEQALFCNKLGAELESWEGTPYRPGMQMKGVGADCVRFVCAVLDFMRGGECIDFATLPQDSAMHTREGAVSVMRKIRQLYMPNKPIHDGSLEPGDIIVVGPSDGGPGHALIVGHRRNEIWHATNVNVHRTGLQFTTPDYRKVFRVYRPQDKGFQARI